MNQQSSSRFSPWGRRRTASRSALTAAVLFLGTLGAARAGEPDAKRLIDVWLPTLDGVVDLQAAGFDVAGVNRAMLAAGVVATDVDLDRLYALGYSFTFRAIKPAEEAVAGLADYTDPQELSALMDQAVATHPSLARKMTLKDALFEGQQLFALKITKDVNLDNGRPSFILDAQHHAREVMTTEIARDMIDYLTSRYATDPQVQRWVDGVNIYIVGSVNPDGAMYVFQHDNMWRKNRRPDCPVDLNRNYPFMWGSCNGSSGVCTDETHRGLTPSSEPETQGLLQLVSDVRPFYTLSYHSYGEYVMYSYGCSDPDERTALDEVARSLNSILQDDSGQTGQYAVGPIWSTIYRVDGGSIDTQYAQYGAYGFTIEVNANSFQPDYAVWRNITVQRQRTAWQFFLDRTLDGPQIRGAVTDGVTGAPLTAEVSVQEVTFTHGESPRRADAHGHYHWLARSGQTYHVTFALPEHCTVTRTVEVGAGPATVDVTLVRPTPPDAVTAFGVGDNQIDVTWSPAVNAAEYRVLRSLTSGGPYSQVALVPAPQTTFHDATVSGGAPYYYVVRALQPCESHDSVEASASTTGPCTLGPAFAGIAAVTNAETSTCALALAWPAAAARCGGRITYEVHRSRTSPFTPAASTLIAAGLGATQFTDHDALANGITDYYIVRAVDSASGASDGNTVILGGAPTGPATVGTWSDDAGDATAAQLSPTAPWSALPTDGKTGPWVYATGVYANNLCSALTTPALSIQQDAVLTFASKYDLESGWDAGLVEVAQGPGFGAWTKLTTVNYPDPLTNAGNACGFPKSGAGTVFSHSYASPSYSPAGYSASLAAYGGQEIKLRWRISSDSTGGGAGWWVDDISVTNTVTRAACSPGAAPSPMEVSPVAAPMAATRAETGTAVNVNFTPGCGTTDNVVYWGIAPITGSLTWTNAACFLGNTGRASFDPGTPEPGTFFYFVIVGQSATEEGSFGQGFDGVALVERPEAEQIGPCDRPQDLTGDCP